MNKIGIIWDLDGTLLDTLEDLAEATNYALRTFGCPERSVEEVRRFVGNGAGRLISRALPGKAEDPDADAVLACFRAYYDTHCRIKTAPYPGMLEVLAELKQAGYPMAVVSNKPDSAVQILCRDYFGELFSAVTGEVAGLPRKPAPDLVFQAVRALGMEPANCIYVGDSEVDIQTAKNAGMTGLCVLWGFRDEELLRENGGVHFCRNVAELPEKVKELEKEIHGK